MKGKGKRKIRERYRKSGKMKSKRVGKRKSKRLTETEARHEEKGCYGSKEWSENAGICKNCKWHGDCGKVENKLPGPVLSILPARIIL